MRRSECRKLAELRSGYVDGALADAERERVLNHLVHCASCRTEVDDLRAVREMLHRIARTGPTDQTPDLSSRLVSIAGSEASEPVWCRPFRRVRRGGLPSPRRSRRLRTTAAAVAFGSLLSTLGVVGYAAAPPLHVTPLGDPSDRVRSEFASALSQFPLSSRSVNALMMTPRSGLSSRPVPTPAARVAGAQLPVTSEMAVALLRRAASQSEQISYSGTQQVTAQADGRAVSATVRIAFEAGQGSSVRVFGRGGQELVYGFVPVSSASRVNDEELLSLLPRSYSVSGWVGSTVLGRPVTVVEAAADVPGGEPRVAARWWVDNGTGLLLRQETYDSSGAPALSTTFTSVTISTRPEFMEHLAPRLATSTTTASLTLSNAGLLSSLGWDCHGALAGLELVRLRSDEGTNPGAVHMVYSDGVSSLSVFEQRGGLAAAPAGSRWDDALGAYLTVGTPTMASWQSGDRVLTVVTDGGVELVEQAVRALPHAEPASRTTMERVHAGWVRILERVVR